MEKELKQGAGKQRMLNLELLRCIAMMMVIVLHYLGKGELLPQLASEEQLNAVGVTAWLLEAFCIVAVNVYMLISGYFLSESSFKPGRLFQLWLQVWSYSAGVGVFACLLGVYPVEQINMHFVLELLFPITMGHYWFMTAYVFLYLLAPLLSAAAKRLTKAQLKLILALLLFTFCVTKTVLPIRLEMDSQGYDCLWYVCVFLTAAYVRRFGIKVLEKKRCAVGLYLAAVLCVFFEAMLLRRVYLAAGSMGRLLTVSFEYNHLFVFLAALGLFCVFKEMKVSGRVGRWAGRIAPYTLGVYLLHENIALRNVWQQYFGAGQVSTVWELLVGTAAAVAAVFTCGCLLEKLRRMLMRGMHRILLRLRCYRRLAVRLETADRLFMAAEEK